jgi:phosphate uptake regulator
MIRCRKVNNHLERMADHAIKVTENVMFMMEMELW